MSEDRSHRHFVDLLESHNNTADDDAVNDNGDAPDGAGSAGGAGGGTGGGNNRLEDHARFDELMKFCRSDLIGRFHPFESPLGWKPTVYADWTASGRAFRFIEDYITSNVLSTYGNTHTSTSITGLQTSCYRHEARQIIAESVNAHAKNDVVIFTGTGSTGAIHTLCHALGLGQQGDVFAASTRTTGRHSDEASAEGIINPSGWKGVVFVGAYEHHSNILPWRESAAKVVTIGLTESGELDEVALESSLLAHSLFPLKVGSFSAASNVTGLLTNVDRISEILHKYGALACWDYATAAPYCSIDMNPVRDAGDPARPYVYKDAVFMSPHKMAGGPGTPGILVAKKRLFNNPVPRVPGGGTVFFVADDGAGGGHRYLSNRIEREEGGTPDIVGSIRAAMAFQVKGWAAKAFRARQPGKSLPLSPACLNGDEASGSDRASEPVSSSLEEHEVDMQRNIAAWLRQHAPNVHVLGERATTTSSSAPPPVRKLPVFSFLVRRGKYYLHYNFVSAVLNDLFGIQARGGCACAGPFAQHLLGMSGEHVDAIEDQLLHTRELLRPGFTRVGFSYLMSPAEIEYILEAIRIVAQDGWRLLPLYRFNHRTGEWSHWSRVTKFPTRRWLSDVSISARTGRPTVFNRRTAGTTATSAIVSDASAHGIRSMRGVVHRSFEDIVSEFTFDPEGECEPDLNKNGSSTKTHPLARILASAREYLEESNILRLLKQTNLNVIRRQLPAEILGGKGETQASDGQHDLDVPSTHSGGAALRWFWFPGEVLAQLMEGADAGSSALEDNSPSMPIDPRRPVLMLQPQLEKRSRSEALGDTPDVGGSAGVQSQAQQLLREAAEKQEEAKKLMSAAAAVEPERRRKDKKHPKRSAVGASAAPAPTTTSAKNAVAGAVGSTSNAVALKPETSSTGDSGATAKASAKAKFPKPPPKLMRAIGTAVHDWDMIHEGDRLLIGLSGGKDSLSMLHSLLALQKRSKVKFEIGAATVDPMTSAFDPSPLKAYVKSLGVPYFFLSDPIFDRAKSGELQGNSICAYCSRMKRGLLYSCCRKEGYNVLVLGQHLDDCAETLLMSLFHNGILRTMHANYVNKEGDVRIIRPLIYARESMLRQFATKAMLPVINENCPACFEQPKERHRVKKVLSQQESLFPNLYPNLRRAILPLMDADTQSSLHDKSSFITGRKHRAHLELKQRLRDKAAGTTVDTTSAGGGAAPTDDSSVSVDSRSPPPASPAKTTTTLNGVASKKTKRVRSGAASFGEDGKGDRNLGPSQSAQGGGAQKRGRMEGAPTADTTQ